MFPEPAILGKERALGRLTRAQKVKPNMADVEGILARHYQSPYVDGQPNFYIFLYFPSKNLIKADEI
jgi:hypothetical protein